MIRTTWPCMRCDMTNLWGPSEYDGYICSMACRGTVGTGIMKIIYIYMYRALYVLGGECHVDINQ